MGTSGRLFLGFNDDYYVDNNGRFEVTITRSITEFTNRTYRIITGTFTWHQAKDDAEIRGGHLATITSQAEFNYIQTLGLFATSEPYWLGATDEGHEGSWAWVTGEPWDFVSSRTGEPNNNQGPEDYLLAEPNSGHGWNDWGRPGYVMSQYLLELDNGPCTPRKAKATAQLINGFVVGATITDGGCGYTNPPAVLIQGGGGNGAMARAVISDGKVTAVEILDAGFGYTTPPRIVIGSPPFVPTVDIAVSKVRVTQNVVLGWKYVLESSTNAVSWTLIGPPFIADSESIATEFDVDSVGRSFRLRVVP
jgi:hypothetical protein